MKISVCIIARNEEESIARCLHSVETIADEVILVDSGSADKTREVARSLGAKVFDHEWEGYVAQKNYAISLAAHDWILSLDADEELSVELQGEIMDYKKGEINIDGFLISRVVFFEGKWIRFGDWYPDYLVRLFRKGKGKFFGGAVHERLELEGRVEKLQGEIFHYTYKDRREQFERIEAYAELWAQSALKEGKKSCEFLAWSHAAWRFFRGYILKGGWRGGRLGWQIAWANAYEVLLKYRKLAKLRTKIF